MAFIWSCILGLIFMIFFKLGGWGLFLGFILGPLLYNVFNRIAPVRRNIDRTLYLQITFEVLGHLSKAKGAVTQNDIVMATRFMDSLQLQGDARRLAQASFNHGKDKEYPLRARLRELYQSYRNQRDILNLFCEHLIQAALIGGQLHPQEEQILFSVADELHISRTRMAMYIQMIMASYHFQQNTQYSRQYQDYRYSNESEYRGYTSTRSNINEAYRVLGITAAADTTTIKRAYRKLMNEHHPDKLISKGLPKEMLEAAKQRAQEIQSAYDVIKAQHGFK